MHVWKAAVWRGELESREDEMTREERRGEAGRGGERRGEKWGRKAEVIEKIENKHYFEAYLVGEKEEEPEETKRVQSTKEDPWDKFKHNRNNVNEED